MVSEAGTVFREGGESGVLVCGRRRDVALPIMAMGLFGCRIDAVIEGSEQSLFIAFIDTDALAQGFVMLLFTQLVEDFFLLTGGMVCGL